MLFCLVWTWLAIVAGDEIAQGLAWSWPEGSFLRLGKSSQLLYTHAEVSAGVEIYGLEIAIPNYQCVTWSSWFGPSCQQNHHQLVQFRSSTPSPIKHLRYGCYIE